jgi:hypothetical protein
MADTVSITAGSGTTIATDQVTLSGVPQHVQLVKLMAGTDGSTVRMALSSGGSIAATVTSATAANFNAQIVGNVAHDAAASGNPLRVGIKARSTLSNVTAVSTHDVTDVYGDLDGVMLMRTQVPLGQLVTGRANPTTAAAATFSNLGATTLLRNYVTSLTVYNHGATAVFVNILNGSTAADVFYTIGAPTKGHSGMNFNPPLRQASTNTALGYKINAAIGGSGVFISVTGFQSKL